MALTFGAATSDKVEIDSPHSLHTDGEPLLVYGWWYPTTLTAGRHYWGVGQFSSGFSGLRVGSTTSEIEWISDFGTTDSVWGTSGAGVAVDKWWFIAALTNGSVVGPNDGCEIWLGDAENCPTALAPTRSVAPVGAPAASTVFDIGNGYYTGTNLSFQGDIAEAGYVTAQGYASSIHMFGMTSATGNVDAGMVDYTFHHWVKQLWAGEYPRHDEAQSATRWVWTHWCGINTTDICLQCGEHATGTVVVPSNAPTLSGPTRSNRRHPRAHRQNLLLPPPLARRR